MRKIILVRLLSALFLFLSGPPLPAQSVRPLKNRTKTYAVVVGVSEYQDPGIEDLSYAHRDAELFAEFLQSEAGGKLDDKKIRLLTNEKATRAAIQSALLWLKKRARPDDRVIIYFSGHGDVETKSEGERGYLLAHDTPKNNYCMNAVGLDYLSDTIVRPMSENEVQVIVITDACHAGKLAGDGIGGRQATAMGLSKRYANEVKIMSCQPYELSQESSKWGGGRGVFSYYLIDGLKGRANDDTDERVDLIELEIFLQENIRKATDKQQHPEIFGGKKGKPLFKVDEATMEALRAVEEEEIMEDIEEKILKKVASEEAVINYERLQDAIGTGDLIEPKGISAVDYYEALEADTTFSMFLSLAGEPLTIVLLDSAQQAINAYLNTDPVELQQRDFFDEKYKRFPAYLKKAAEILTNRDPRHRETVAKQYYFEGLVLRLEGEQSGGKDTCYQAALEKQHEALKLQDRAAYVHNEIGLLLLELGETDSSRNYFQRAAELSPTWAIPHYNMAIALFRLDSIYRSLEENRKALSLKEDFASAYTLRGNLFDHWNMVDSAEINYIKAIELYPTDKYAHLNYGIMLAGVDDRLEEAEAAYREALAIDPGFEDALLGIGLLFEYTEQYDSAMLYFKKAISTYPDHPDAYHNLGHLHYLMALSEETDSLMLLNCHYAIDHYEKAISLDPGFAPALKDLGYLNYLLDKTEGTDSLLLIAFQLDPGLPGVMLQLAEVLIDYNKWQDIVSLPLSSEQKWTLLYFTGTQFYENMDYDNQLKAYKLAQQISDTDQLKALSKIAIFSYNTMEEKRRNPHDNRAYIEVIPVLGNATREEDADGHSFSNYQPFKEYGELKRYIDRYAEIIQQLGSD